MFKVILQPDTQCIFQDLNPYKSWHLEAFKNADWIKNNTASLNIKALIHVGDINEWGRRQDWAWAREWADRCGDIVKCLCVGNHDFDKWSTQTASISAGLGDRSINLMNEYFPQSYLKNVVGSLPTGRSGNVAQTFTADGLTFLVISVNYYPTAAELTWLDQTIAAHPTKHVLINTHTFMNGTTRDAAGNKIWAVAKKHANVRMIFNGHYYPVAGHRVDKGDKGNDIIQVMVDYQNYNSLEPNTYFQILTFDTDQLQLQVKTYSPALNKYMSGSNNDFTLSGLGWLAEATPDPEPGEPVAGIRIAFLDNSVMDSVSTKLKTWIERSLAAHGMTDAEIGQMYITSANRGTSNVDYHTDTGVNGAIDIAAPMTDAGRRLMQKAARMLIEDRSLLLEMIHSTPYSDDNGFYVKNGQLVAGSLYGEPDFSNPNKHHTHIHLASTETLGDALVAKYPATPIPPVPPAPPTSGIPVGSFGVDYAFSRPSIPGLKTANVKFAFRYLSFVNNLTRPKILTNAEALALSQAGIAVVSNYEWYPERCTEGFAAGAEDARIAVAQARDAGAPDGKPIYFSVDKDVSPDSVRTYFQGIASVLPLSQIGVYGSFRVVKALKEASLATWLWQTYAWSGGQWYPGNHVEQYLNTQQLAGGDVDFNRNKVTDFGQWFHTSVAPPAPPALPSVIPMTGVDMPFVHGQVEPGTRATVVSTAWQASQLSLGCTAGKAKLKVRDHVVNEGWKETVVTVSAEDNARTDIPPRVNVDRREVTRVKLDDADQLDAPVGYLAWW